MRASGQKNCFFRLRLAEKIVLFALFLLILIILQTNLELEEKHGINRRQSILFHLQSNG